MGLKHNFEVISDDMNLEAAIKLLEKLDYGIIRGESNKIESLVTAKILRDIYNKIDLDSKKEIKLNDIKIKQELPPTFITFISSKEDINENYHSVEVDAPIIEAGAIGAIVIREQVEGIIPLEVSSKAVPGGKIGIECRENCENCGRSVTYHRYPEKCEYCGKPF